ncbi:MAG: hypothetical protein FWD52_07765 [Candidatus Bathyarchaeota archaeon]|nr:hypothetical protein [Candidatus Termiticorpusculum sp.]
MNQKTKNLKSMIAMTLTIIMVVSMLSTLSAVTATDDLPFLTLKPSTNVDLTYPAYLEEGSTFTVQVNIANVKNLWGLNFDLTWNPDVITITRVQKGDFLISGGVTDIYMAPTFDHVNGRFGGNFAQTLMEYEGVSGEGTLAIVTFTVKDFGTCNIALTNVLLFDDTPFNPQPMAYAPLPSIRVNNPTPPASAPTAAFTVTADVSISGQYITIPSSASSANIELDASISGAGYDGTNTVPITSYSWVIHSVNGRFSDIIADTQKITLNNVEPDVLEITLTVKALTGKAVDPPGYVNTAQISRTYTIIQAASSGIDIFTQNGGIGPNAPGGIFGPQQQVAATARVIYNGAPVAQKDVIFTVYTNNGAEYAYDVVRTDAKGEATFYFRLITNDGQLDASFGANWLIVASVDISEVVYSDTCRFEFNYLANIKDVTVSPSTVIRGQDTVTITANIDNKANVDGIVTFTLVDACNVPIAATSTTISSGSVQITINIPNYAFVGQAKVNVNLLSAAPKDGGVPYCPQNGANVTFDSNGLFVSSIQNQPAQFLIGFI